MSKEIERWRKRPTQVAIIELEVQAMRRHLRVVRYEMDHPTFTAVMAEDEHRSVVRLNEAREYELKGRPVVFVAEGSPLVVVAAQPEVPSREYRFERGKPPPDVHLVKMPTAREIMAKLHSAGVDAEAIVRVVPPS